MRGVSLMVMRTLILYPIGLVGEICLARLLTPEDFGVYALASFVTVTLAGVLEVGLAASLIQRKAEPRDEEYQVLFSLQILGITALVLFVFFLAPYLFPLLDLDAGIRWKLLVLLFCPWISSFATMSSVKLERELRYDVFAKIDILRGLTYVATAVPLAYLGCKSWSFIGAITLSTIVKAWVAFREAPWPVRFQTAPQGNEAYSSLWYHFPAVHLDVFISRPHRRYSGRATFRSPIGRLLELGEEYDLLHKPNFCPGCF